MTIAVLVVLAILVLLAGSRRYAWWRRTVPYEHPRILMYHMVSEHRPGGRFNKLRVKPAAFERQLRWLRDEGWHFASMSELSSGAKLPARSVILTFDDGYADNLLNADPLIARYGARATLYLVEDRFDRDWSSYKKAHHDSGELAREPKLSDEQLQQMLASGRWELGGHTRTHAYLPSLSAEQREEEISGARESLGALFNIPLETFAYPFGIYTPADVEAVRCAGFSSAVTTEEGIPRDLQAQALELPRVKVSGKDSMLAFRLRLRSGRRGA